MFKVVWGPLAPNQGTTGDHLLMTCCIPGNPLGKGRPRTTKTGHVYTPKGTAEYERAAALLMRQQWKDRAPFDEACVLSVVAVKARPKRLLRVRDPEERIPCTTKPDGDNILKIIADALVKAGCIRDDVLIVEWHCQTLFASKTEGPSVFLHLFSYDPTTP